MGNAESILLAHPGTQHSAQLAKQLHQHLLLQKFVTGFSLTENSLPYFGTGIHRVLERKLGARWIKDLPAEKLKSFASIELSALLWARLGKTGLDAIYRRNLQFQQAIATSWIERSLGVIGFDTSAWDLFERAKVLDKKLFLDRSTTHASHWVETQFQLHAEYPDWIDPPTPRPIWQEEAEAIEHELADKIVVGGKFAKQTLVDRNIPNDKVIVNPYGVDFQAFQRTAVDITKPKSLRFLFLGSVTARKGIPLLLEAWRKLGWPKNIAELWIAGPISQRIRSLIPSMDGVEILGKVNRVEIPKLMSKCDALVLPSYSEGFGLVLLEAVAAGLPIIATHNTGGPDIVHTPSLGRLFNAGNLQELVEHLQYYRDCPPNRVMVQTAAQELESEFSWNAYGDRWASIIEENC